MGLETPTTDLAGRILVTELGVDSELPEVKSAVEKTFKKLSVLLSARLGTAGYSALLKRALSLAARDFPWLTSIRVSENGDVDGLDGVGEPKSMLAGSVAVFARLIELLDTFIGRMLTIRVLHGAWPDAVPIDTPGSNEGSSAQIMDRVRGQGESNG